ncbi:MAG: hypothetical protein ACTSRT_03025 [Promethearchaeota archaeon]
MNNTEGTIEFWMASSSSSIDEYTGVSLNNETDTLVEVLFWRGFIYIKRWGYYQIVGSYNLSTWYHIRIDYRSESGNSYMGLSNSQYRLYINSDEMVTYDFNNPGDPELLHLHGGNGFFDAFGYSWDPQYNIGDNFNEGLLLDFKSKYPLEWKAYSLDGQNNLSIIGNTVIPFPDDGSHIIQVIGNNSLGEIFETEKRHFVVDTRIPEIMILSPIENKDYGELAPKYDLFIDEENLISAWYTIDGGITNFSITELNDYIDQDAWLAPLNGPITVEFYAKDIVGRIGYKNITIIKNVINPLTIEIVDFFFSTEVFNLTFYICNETVDGIDFADVQIWWDGIEVSSDVQNLGDGLYFISLDPITVVPGEDPITLQISAYATGYDGKYFETAISVDPDTLQKDTPEDRQIDGFPVEIIVISISLSSTAVLGVGIYILIRRRKKLR